MKASARGRITLPRHLRERFGTLPECEIDFAEPDGGLYLRKRGSPDRGQETVHHMTGKGSVKMTTEEILAMTREP